MIMLYLLIGVIFVYYIFRLFGIQIVQGQTYKARADDNRTETISVPTTRGIIYDRNGYVLAENIPSYNVVITPAYLPDDVGAQQLIFRQLSALIGVPVSKGGTDKEIVDEVTVKNFKPCVTDIGITQIVYIGDTNWPYSAIRIKCNVDEKIARIVKEKSVDWQGVGIEVIPIRSYPTGSLTSEIIGFLGPIPAAQEDQYKALGFVPNRDKVGYAGVEQSMQDVLGGKNGQRTIEVDVAGKELRDLTTPIQPEPGQNVRLTIDTRLQNIAKTALISEINYINKHYNLDSHNGVVIAMNPKTGEVLALVSYPTYENNRMAQVIPADYYQQLLNDPNRPLFNHAISAEHPPGSVFKLGTAIGALNEGVITPEKLIDDPGSITIMQKYYENDPGTPRKFVCWKRDGHGLVDFLHGVAYSCDVYFYKLGGGYGTEVPEGLGIWRIGDYVRSLGYGIASGIELPGEAKGLIPDPTWKRINLGENWATGDTYIATIGQGYVLATPIQVLESAATIADNGIHMKPTLIKDIEDTLGNVVKPFTPIQLWDITQNPMINTYQDNIPTGEKKTVAPWTIQLLKQGMQMVVSIGTAQAQFEGDTILSAGKTGTAEYCDNIAQAKNLCKEGLWPAHAWYVGYAPYDDPEIAVVAFVYNGHEGSTVAAPVVRKVLDGYFELKAIDAANGPQPQPQP